MDQLSNPQHASLSNDTHILGTLEKFTPFFINELMNQSTVLRFAQPLLKIITKLFNY